MKSCKILRYGAVCGLAALAAARGYRLILVMPETMLSLIHI